MIRKLFRKTPTIRNCKLNLTSLEARDVPANFSVINTNDSGIGSLRQAVINANNSAGDDDIYFAAGTFSNPQTITLASQIDFTQEVTLHGPGKDLLTISGGNTTRIFRSTAAGQAVYLNDITLANGKVTGTNRGAAIDVGVNATVYLYNSLVRNNTSENFGAVSANNSSFYSYGTTFRDNKSDDGAAVCASSGANIIFNVCRFENNSSTHEGGAIFMGNCNLGLTDTTFTGNTAGYDGGALFVDALGNWNISGCTFDGNKASSGGALAFQNGNNVYSNRNIRSSTFTGNTAVFRGGAIDFLDMSAGDAGFVQNCTIVGNSAGFNGGGISFENVQDVNGIINVGSSIVAGNTAPAGADLHSANSSSIISTAYSAVGTTAGSVAAFNNLPGVATPLSLNLGALSDNGGVTRTIALADDSPARNKGFNYQGDFSEDQRGEPRVTNGQADIGAYESRQQFIVTNNKDSGAGSLRQAFLDSNAFDSAGDLISFDPVYFSVARQITLTSGPVASNGNVEVAGPGADMLIISGNNAGNGVLFLNVEGLSILRGVTIANVVGTNALQLSTDEFLLEDSRIRDNSAAASSAVLGSGTLTINGSEIANNTTGDPGGGIEYVSSAGLLTIRNSTVRDNRGTIGGGLYADGSVKVINSTFSGNSATSTSGAIHLGGMDTPLFLINSTITNNTSATQGGGIHIPGLPGQSVELASSIVAGNSAPSAKDIFTFHVTTPVNARSSAVGSLSGIAKFNDNGGNIAPGTDLKLNPLTNTGGLGRTHLPRPGSPLLNAGSNVFGLATDQRGLPRSFQGGADIGAAEAQIAPQVEVFIDIGKDQRSMVRSATLIFDRVVNLGFGAFDVIRQGPGNPTGPVGLNVDTGASTPTQTIVNLTWTNPAFLQYGSLIDGNYVLAGVAAQIADTDGLKIDGNGDGLGGDTLIHSFHRLFGDSNGDRTVDAVDFADFGNYFGGTHPGSYFDFDINGSIDASDLAEFGNRFGLTL